MPPTISIVTPSYNQARYLPATLRSVISQRPHVTQYIVIDDGSRDDSAKVIEQHASGIDFWTVQENAGQAAVLARGLGQATGDVLGWINSDDLLLPEAAGRIAQAFERNPTWDVLTGYSVYIDSDDRLTRFNRIPRESARAARAGVLHVTQPTCFFRRSIYEKVGGINTALQCVMDTELWLRFFEANAVWGHVPHYLAAFRIHARSKGKESAWSVKYRKEESELAARFSQYLGNTRAHRLGRWRYRIGQVLSGRAVIAGVEGLLRRGKPLLDQPAS